MSLRSCFRSRDSCGATIAFSSRSVPIEYAIRLLEKAIPVSKLQPAVGDLLRRAGKDLLESDSTGDGLDDDTFGDGSFDSEDKSST